MSDKEQMTTKITEYMNLLRIEKAADKDKEIGNQKRELIAQLEALGVTVEKLEIE